MRVTVRYDIFFSISRTPQDGRAPSEPVMFRNVFHRQKAFIVPGVVPPGLQGDLEAVPTWDDGDPDVDNWYLDWQPHSEKDTP